MLANILLLVINAAAGFITLMLLARFYMQWQRISFRNQIGQFVVNTTDWIVRPLRRFIPGLFGLDMASLLPAWVVQVLLVAFELSLRGAVFSGNTAAVIAGLAGVGLIELVRMMVYLLFAVVLGSAVLSWVSPHSPLAPLLNAIAAPVFFGCFVLASMGFSQHPALMPYGGLWQRLALIIGLGWLAVLAIRLRRPLTSARSGRPIAR